MLQGGSLPGGCCLSAPTAKSTPTTTPGPGTHAEAPASLSIDGELVELPVVVGTEGERALDISRLRAGTGLITLDEGYVNTGSTTSGITFLNGEEGVLRYRGYPSKTSPVAVILSRSPTC